MEHVYGQYDKEEQVYYRGRSGDTAENIMVVCDFKMLYTCVYAGTPGSVHDSRILRSCINEEGFRFPNPPPGKYYLVDYGYANMEGFLAPCWGTTYHQNDFGGRRPQGLKEQFNFAHSGMRNAAERIIGGAKLKFNILRGMNHMHYDLQRKIVIACCALWNYIKLYDKFDLEELMANTPEYPRNNTSSSCEIITESEEELQFETTTMAAVTDGIELEW